MGMTITIRVEYPEETAQAIKEALAMDCEKYGTGVRVVNIEVDRTRQETLWP